MLFNWNDNGVRCNEATSKMLQTVCAEMGIGYAPQMLPMFLSGELWQVLKNFPELEFFRDVCFYSK